MKNVKNMKSMSMLMVIMAIVTSLTMTAAAQEVDGTGTWNTWASMGLVGAIGAIFAAVVVWVIFEEKNPMIAKIGALACVIFAVVAAFGIKVATDDNGTASIDDFGDDVTPAGVFFDLTVHDSNNTAICSRSAGLGYHWKTIVNYTSGEVTNATDTITLNFTVDRGDLLSGFYYTDAYIDIDSIPWIESETTGNDYDLIAKTNQLWSVTFVDTNSAQSNEALRVPQAETTRENFQCILTLNHGFMDAMYDNSIFTTGFDIIIDDFTVPITVELDETHG